MGKMNRKKKYNSYTNEDLQKALNDITQNGASTNGASKRYKIPESTLRKKLLLGQTTKSDSYNKSLTTAEEDTLFEWMINCANSGFPRNSSQLRREARRLYERTPRKPIKNRCKEKFPTRHWCSAFAARIGRRNGTRLSRISLANTVIADNTLKLYHERAERFLAMQSLELIHQFPYRIGNADVLEMPLTPKDPDTFTIDGSKHELPVDEVTVMYTVLGTNRFLSPYIVLPADQISETIPEDIELGRSKSGSMTPENFLEYLDRVVVKYLNDECVERPFVLFIDSTICTNIEVIQYCKEQEICLLTLFPSTKRAIQPLDAGIFTYIQSQWNDFLYYKETIACGRTIADLLKEFMGNHEKELKQLIPKAFSDTGIIPWDRDAINLKELLETCRKRDVDRYYAGVFVTDWPKDESIKEAPWPITEINETNSNDVTCDFSSPTSPDPMEVSSMTPEIIPDEITSYNTYGLNKLMKHCPPDMRDDLKDGFMNYNKTYSIHPLQVLHNLMTEFKADACEDIEAVDVPEVKIEPPETESTEKINKLKEELQSVRDRINEIIENSFT